MEPTKPDRRKQAIDFICLAAGLVIGLGVMYSLGLGGALFGMIFGGIGGLLGGLIGWAIKSLFLRTL